MESPTTALSAHLPPDLAHLARTARGGDVAALGTLYDVFADSLYKTAYRLTGDADDAQDIVHDCFVGLPEALRHYDERGALGAWLRRIVVRLVLMRRRSELRRREDPIDVIAALPATHRSDSSTDVIDIRRVVNALPESLRDVFILKQIEGYSHDEIAELLGISSGASRVRLTRALDALRRALISRD